MPSSSTTFNDTSSSPSLIVIVLPLKLSIVPFILSFLSNIADLLLDILFAEELIISPVDTQPDTGPPKCI